MASCYCANYYGSVNCRNTVSRFGDRCKLCLALKSGASLSNGLLPRDELWISSPRPSAPKRNDNNSSHSSSGTTGRSSGVTQSKYY